MDKVLQQEPSPLPSPVTIQDFVAKYRDLSFDYDSHEAQGLEGGPSSALKSSAWDKRE